MQKSGNLPAIIINIILFLGLAAIWIVFAPTNLGGQVSYVMVNGISMEPGFHLGDLTIIRKAAEYQVGDVVTYNDSQMQAYVIHRIIGTDQDRYILKGDNNSWIDAYRPTNEEVIGKLWIHIPGFGKVIKWLRSPLNLALTVGLLGGILMVNMVIKPNQQGRSKNAPPGSFGGMLEGGIYLFGISALIFLGLGIFSLSRPLTRPADEIKYLQESQFSYSATGTPGIYDTNVVRSGEPVFPRLTCFLNIGFNYRVIGGGLQGVSGMHQLVAKVMDEQSGWQRTIAMNQPSAFDGEAFSTSSTLDLCQIVALVNTLEQETGLRAGTYTLEIIPQVTMYAVANGTQISDSFDPKLVFRFDEVHFSLSSPKGQEDPLSLSQQSSVPNPNLTANTLSVLGWEPSVRTIRMMSLFGLVVSLGGLFLIGLQYFGTTGQNEEAMIRLKYGALLVNVYEHDIEPFSRLIDVTTIDELAKLAERHNTVILHMTLNFLHCYLVQSNSVTYRFIFSAGKRNTPMVEAPRSEMVEYAFNIDPVNVVETRPADKDRYEFVVDPNSFRRARAEETIVLRKVKL